MAEMTVTPDFTMMPDRETRKEIEKLLRFLGNSGCRAELAPDRKHAMLRLTHPDGRTTDVQKPVAAEAASLGLLVDRNGLVAPTREARSFLRRQRAARDEAMLDQHRAIEIGYIVEGDASEPVRINASESPLAQFARMKDKSGAPWFADEALAAGERLARDFHFAGLQPKITPNYAPRLGDRVRSAPGAGVELKDNVVAARLRVARALTAIGPELSGVALDICCFEKGLETVERERQWPARSAKLMLKTALMALDRHYRPGGRGRANSE
ncbi:hypothetical protein M2360_004565 [Rhizobium sp. SG_E_25_P2]|uniref:DUF6456 domain-containing protein n=1 Tax=Rhizobium sp. SG_E_25_P2 TaxID=2879942 RepID=UPI002474C2F8|nr:DUF6456 domain-containing protein [Rhizobium sp. SG_E_25_P2]MDH6269139.1 hypothetical protein [Rhizobium sp. SG_E_25_P2]